MVIFIIQGKTKNGISHDFCFTSECRMFCFSCKLWNDEDMKHEDVKFDIFSTTQQQVLNITLNFSNIIFVITVS